MQEKIKQLELLITQTLTRQKELAAQNAALKNRLRTLEQSSLVLREAQASLRELKEWKKNTQTVLHRLLARIDKELGKVQEEQDKIL